MMKFKRERDPKEREWYSRKIGNEHQNHLVTGAFRIFVRLSVADTLPHPIHVPFSFVGKTRKLKKSKVLLSNNHTFFSFLLENKMVSQPKPFTIL